MVGRTTKRTFLNDTTFTAVDTIKEVTYTVTADKVNCSNIWGSIGLEPENADANANGSWALYATIARDTGFTWDDTLFNDEPEATALIAGGIWCASNQTPFVHTFSAGKVSRNIRRDCMLSLQVYTKGISAGNVSARLMLMCNVTTL